MALPGFDQVPGSAEDVGHVAGGHGAATAGLALFGQEDAAVAAEDAGEVVAGDLEQATGLVDDVAGLELDVLDAGEGPGQVGEERDRHTDVAQHMILDHDGNADGPVEALEVAKQRIKELDHECARARLKLLSILASQDSTNEICNIACDAIDILWEATEGEG